MIIDTVETWFDTSGRYFSDGIEVVFRVCRFIGLVLLVVIGGFAFLLFQVIASPIILLGWFVSRLGFKSEWHR